MNSVYGRLEHCIHRLTNWLPRRSSASPIIILDADDVVLAEIAAGLHLDQLQQDLAGIFQPVDGADRDVDRFVLVHGLDQFVRRVTRAVPRTTIQCSARW